MENAAPWNNNIVLIGGPGTGKTSIIKNSLFDVPTAGKSVVVVSSDRSIAQEYEGWFRGNGYTTKVFNLADVEKSDRWNPLQGLTVKDVEDVADAMVRLLVVSGGKENNFSFGLESLILKSLIAYIVKELPQERRNIITLYGILSSGDNKQLWQLFSVLPSGHLAKEMFNALFNASDETIANGFTNLANKFSIFHDLTVRCLTTPDINESIDLSLPGRKKCAYFMVVPAITRRYNLLSGLFMYNLFKELWKTANDNDDTLPVSVDIIIDDLEYLPEIPEFLNMITALTGKGVRVTLAMTGLPALKKLYPADWEGVLGVCRHWVVTGITDSLTKKYLATFQDNSTAGDLVKISHNSYNAYDKHPLADELNNVLYSYRRTRMPWVDEVELSCQSELSCKTDDAQEACISGVQKADISEEVDNEGFWD